MPDANINGGAQVDANGTIAPAAGAVVADATKTAVNPEGLTLSELNEALGGKDFKDKATAIKSLKDLNSYVGKKVGDIKNEVVAELKNNDVTNALAKELSEMRKGMFYKDNPQYATPEVREIIEGLGTDPAEVVGRPAFKAVMSKVSGYDETQKLKTVFESNPRLVVSKDNLTKARQLSKEIGTDQGQTQEQVESLVAGAVRAARG